MDQIIVSHTGTSFNVAIDAIYPRPRDLSYDSENHFSYRSIDNNVQPFRCKIPPKL